MTTLRFTLLSLSALLALRPGPAVSTNFVYRYELPDKQVEIMRKWDLLPPPEHDRPYTGVLTVIRGTQDELRAQCPIFRPYNWALGCSPVRMNRSTHCIVYIADDATLKAAGWRYDLVLRHELGHCNGWRHEAYGLWGVY